MNFVRLRRNKRGGAFIFKLTARDRDLLLSLLKLFPVTDAASRHLSRTEKEARAAQDLLVEAVQEQQRDHGARIAGLLKNDPLYFRELADGLLQLELSAEEMEWLLQSLNDIRVGSWTRLGCPEMEAAVHAIRDEEGAIHYTAMELSGYFQGVLLEAFQLAQSQQ